MYDLTVFGLRYVRRATSALLLALCDQSEDLRLAIGDPFPSPRPVEPRRTRCPATLIADHGLARVDGLDGVDQLSGGQGLGEIPVDSEAAGGVDEFGLKVPRVDDDAACSRVVEQLSDLLMIRFGLREGVVEDDIDDGVHLAVRVDLCDDDAVAVFVEQVCHAFEDDVIVVHQRHDDRAAL